jgi:hypothetical protein
MNVGVNVPEAGLPFLYELDRFLIEVARPGVCCNAVNGEKDW